MGTNPKKLFLIGVTSLMLVSSPTSWAWDGRWANGASGVYPLPDNADPYKSKNNESGIEPKDSVRHYHIPPNPQFEDVDPDENVDNYDKDYSPYALMRLSRDVKRYGQTLGKGYYLVKIGNWLDGSQKMLQNLSKNGVEEPIVGAAQMPKGDFPDKWKEQAVKKADKADQKRQKEKEPPYSTLIFKQNGKVVLMLPIERRELVVMKRTDSWKLPKTPLAWVEADANQPEAPVLLKFYYHHMVYIAQLGQA